MSILFFVPFYSEPIIENSNKLIYIKNINIILRSDYARGEFSHGDLHFSYIFHEIEKCNMHFASRCVHTPISLNGALMKEFYMLFFFTYFNVYRKVPKKGVVLSIFLISLFT